jgi:hypothetical protein
MWPILGSPPHPPPKARNAQQPPRQHDWVLSIVLVRGRGLLVGRTRGAASLRQHQAPKRVAAHVCSRIRGRDAVREHGRSSVV